MLRSSLGLMRYVKEEANALDLDDEDNGWDRKLGRPGIESNL